MKLSKEKYTVLSRGKDTVELPSWSIAFTTWEQISGSWNYNNIKSKVGNAFFSEITQKQTFSSILFSNHFKIDQKKRY